MASTTTQTTDLADRLERLDPHGNYRPFSGGLGDYEREVAALVNGIGARAFLNLLAELEAREKAAYRRHCSRKMTSGLSHHYRAGSVRQVGHGSWVSGPDPKAQAEWQRLGGLLRLLRPHAAACRAAIS